MYEGGNRNNRQARTNEINKGIRLLVEGNGGKKEKEKEKEKEMEGKGSEWMRGR